VEEIDIPEGPMGAAMYLAIMAYPSAEDIPKRDRFIDAVRGMIHKDIVKVPELTKRIKQMRNRDIDSVLDRAAMRISTRRVPAARILWRLIANAKVNGEESAKSVHSAIEIHQRVMDVNYGGGDAANLRRILWRESLPVIHLAYSFLWAGEKRGRNLVQSIKSPGWVTESIKRAESTRLFLSNRDIVSNEAFVGLLSEVKSVRLFTFFKAD
jgi:hypothetical protein